MKEKAHTRVTTFIDVLDAKDNLMDWKARMVLIGVAMDPRFLDGVSTLDPDDPDSRKALSRKAEAAAEKAGAGKKAEDGTRMHELTEAIDRGEEPKGHLTAEDVADIYAYREATRMMTLVHIERLVVNDEYGVAGTPDRVSMIDPDWLDVMVAPDGTRFGADELIITDLKTGRIDFGALKMAMQLSIYANSQFVDMATGERSSMGPVNKKWGIIMHMPIGSASCTLYWVDLTVGYQAVALAKAVREIRKQNRKVLTALSV
jgi:hypothetical protein